MWGVRSNSAAAGVALLFSVIVSCAVNNASDDPLVAVESGAGGSALPASGGVGVAARGSGGGSGVSGAQSSSGGTSQRGGASSMTGGAGGDASIGSGGAPNGDASAGAGGATESGGASPASGGSSPGGTSNGGGTATGGATTGTGGAAMGGANSTGGAPTGGRSNTGGAPTGGANSTGGAPTGGASSTGGVPATGGAGGSPTGCLSTPIMTKLGKSSVLVGASMSDATATAAPFDMRYLYLAGGLFDGTSPCNSCATGCTANSVSCANSGPGCAWWGCWQWDQDPPGAYARGFFGTAVTNNQFPMITYYEMYAAAGNVEGAAEVAATNNTAVMHRYIADWKFVIDQVAGRRVFLHIEPDFWGFAEQVNQNPHSIPAAVASAHSECAGFENSIAGLGRCMIDMVRRHAPTALVGLHGSGWATKIDVLQNKNASLDVVGEANKLGAFLSECGAGSSDFVVVDPSDRDAAWYESQGQNRWWDATNATLPNFHQGFTWAKALAERVGVPIVWWQVPVGNMSQNNTNQHWRDNRVDYFFGHMDEVAASHGVAVLFGAGDGAQTTPETDGGNLIAKMKAYAGARTPACP